MPEARQLPKVVSAAITAAFVGGPPDEKLVRHIADLAYAFGRQDAILDLHHAERKAIAAAEVRRA